MLRHVRSRLGSTLSTERITDVDRLSIADIHASLGLEPTGDPETDRQSIEEALADRDNALFLLEQIPVACLVVLEGLIEMRGHAGPAEIRDLIQERTTFEFDEHLEDVAATLSLYGLATVSIDCTWESEPGWLFLTTAAAQWCPALLKGLTLPRRPPAPPLAERWDPPGEETLRFVHMLDRRALRLTRSGMVHRGDLRGYARALDCSELEVGDRFMHAIELGLLGSDDSSRMWPFPKGIRRALAQELNAPPNGSIDQTVWAILPDDGSWVPEEAVARACVRIAGLRDFTTVARAARMHLRPTVWVERGRDVSGLWMRRRDPSARHDLFADEVAWKRLARNPRRPAYLTPVSSSLETLEAELTPFATGRIGHHELEKRFMRDVPADAQDMWVPLTCGAAESLRVRYEQAMTHRFAGDLYELPGQARHLFSGPDWRPRPVSQAQIHAAIEDAAAAKRPIALHVERESGLSVHWVRPIRVHSDGLERSVLAVDVDTEVGLVFPLSQVIEVDTVRRFCAGSGQ